jgi:cob(I)alamin adenosyltransferase
MKKFGYFQVYTGCGKGKTTAAFGLALRAAGNGFSVYIGQFMKAQVCGEHRAMKKFKKLVTIEQFGRKRFIMKDRIPSDADKEAAREGLEKVRQAIHSGKHNIVIMDEINMAVAFNLLDLAEVLEVILGRPDDVELIATGREAPEEFKKHADLVSEIKEVKHYFKKGVQARKGIEK